MDTESTAGGLRKLSPTGFCSRRSWFIARLHGNTNFDQISDWLTKILVGAGLVELAKIGGVLYAVAETLKSYLGEAAHAVAPTIIVIYLITGFLVTYLWARLYLTRQMQESEIGDDPEVRVGLMNAFLYVPKPRGFMRVLEIAADSR